MRLITLCAVLCVLPLALLTYLTIDLANQAVVREVNARVKTTSAVTSALVQQQMRAVAALTASYASRPVLIAAMGHGDPARFDLRGIDRQLAQLAAAQVGSGGAFLTDTNCRLTNVRPATPGIVGRSFAFRDWCKGVPDTGRAYVSDAYKTAIKGHPLVVTAAVIVRVPSGPRAGRPLGILGLVYRLDALRAFANQMATVQGIDLTITDKQGTVLVGGSRKLTGLVSARYDDRVREALAGRSGSTRTTTRTGETLGAYSPVAEIGWSVTAEVPSQEALSGFRKLRATFLTVAALLGIVLLAGMILLTRTLRLRRRAERTLVERDVRTRAILEAATDAFVSMDGAGAITAWNGRAHEIFGWTEAEVLGRKLSDTIIPASSRAMHERRLAHFLATGDGPVLNERIEVTALHRDGHEFPVELAAWPVRSNGTWTFNAFVHDITERLQAQTDLAVARDQALEASRLKSDFLANMSHEIRTPMNGVLGMTSVLLETELDPRQRDYAETVRNSGEALLTIIDDILDFSKVEAGKLEVDDIEFSLRTIVDDVLDLLARPAQAKGLELIATLEGPVPPVVAGDPGRIRQVLLNLVGNAVKFTNAGEVGIRVSRDEADGDKAVIRFEVTDTGDGIAADKLDLIFQPFVQADTSTTRRYGGTGLGLSISSQLVALMGGDCGVTSRQGQGSTFWFTVCVEAESDEPDELLAPDADLSEVTALVVDDNATQRRVLSESLAAWGMTVKSTDSGPAAMEAMRSAVSDGRPVAVALIDRSMPGMDGLELATAVVADPALSVRLVLITDLGDDVAADDLEARGIRAALSKPIHLVDLHAALRDALELPSTEAALVDPEADGSPVEEARMGRLLLAEDNLINQKVAVAMLSGAGYQVDTVVNGAAAVEASAAGPYDAILMDCQMPELNGYEATAAIRAHEGSERHTPIIALTAGARREDRERCLAEGMDGYLAKPVSKDALLSLVAWSVKKGQL